MKTNKELIITFKNGDNEILTAYAFRKFFTSYQAILENNKILIPFDKIIDIKESSIENDVYIEY